jgi:group I intron endonuclease
MIGTAFLGYNNSPKWFKFEHKINKRNDFIINQVNIRNRNKPKINLIAKRYNSTLTINSNSSKSHSKELFEFLKDKNINPVFIYESLHLDSIRKQILSETRELSGIYLILNKVTLDYYIGSASTNKIYARFSNHLLNLNGSKIIKFAVKKYKLSEFAFLVLELFPEIVNKENNKNLLNLEDFYLKSLLPNYNILTEAGSSFGYKHTEITRLKMKTNYSLERRINIEYLNKGKNLSKEIIEKIREKALKRKIPIYSDQAIKNMKKNSKAILVYNLDYTVYGEYSSITDGAKAIGCNIKTICRALKTKKKLLKKRWIVKYV